MFPMQPGLRYPVMWVQWEDGEGRMRYTTGWLIHNDGEPNGELVLAADMYCVNSNEMVMENPTTIPINNIHRTMAIAPPPFE